jgi:predicted GNAT superfamily acetyltransferase
MANKPVREDFEKVISSKGRRFLLRVETSDDARDYAKYEALREEIWGFPEDNLPGTRNLMCENFLHEGSALFIGVYGETEAGVLDADPEHFIGFSYGFIGVKDKDISFRRTDNLQFYSQYTAVKEEFRRYGLGVLIKEFQREKILRLFGISTITCTYDPLTEVNAWRNVHYFGMDVVEYRVSTYGEYGGLLNRLDIPSDRFFTSWDLTKKVRPRKFDYAALLEEKRYLVQAEEKTIKGRSGTLKLECVVGVGLDRIDKESEFLFVQIPRDFYLMLRETDVEDGAVRRIPLDWRLQTRHVFQTLFLKEYRIADFLGTADEPRENFYVLKK